MKKQSLYIVFILLITLFVFSSENKVYANNAKIMDFYPNFVNWRELGVSTAPIPNGFVPLGMQVDGLGELRLYIINPSTGKIMDFYQNFVVWRELGVSTAPIPNGFVPLGMQVDGIGQLRLYIINPSTGKIMDFYQNFVAWRELGVSTAPIPTGFVPLDVQINGLGELRSLIINPSTGKIMDFYPNFVVWRELGVSTAPIPTGFIRLGLQINGLGELRPMIIQGGNKSPIVLVIPNQSINGKGQTKAVNLSSYFSDPDGDALTYTASSSNTTNLSVSLSGSILTLTGNKKGSATITVTASDGKGGIVSTNFVTTVNNTAPTTPTLTVPTSQFEHGDPHIISWNATDVDNDTLTYTLEVSYNNGSTWTQLYNGANKNYTFTVPSNQTQVNFRIRAYDGTVYSAYATNTNKTIIEPLYYWSKYTVKDVKNETLGPWQDGGWTSATGGDILNFSTFNRNPSYAILNGEVVLTGSFPKTNTYVPVGTIWYDFAYYTGANGEGERRLAEYTLTDNSYGYNRSNMRTALITTLSTYKAPNTLVQSNIQAKYNAYIHNAVNYDGYWWIRGQRISAPDSSPPIIELTEQTSYGATSTITVKTYDTSAVSVTKWASGNQSISYFVSSGTNVSSGKFVATTNGIHTVYAKDANGNQSVQTINVSKIDTINPTFVSTAIEGATYMDGNNYWIKPGEQMNIRLRGKDVESGVDKLFYYIGLGNDLSRSYYDFSTNSANVLMPTEGWQNIEFVDIVKTYDDGIEKESLLTIKAKSTSELISYRYLYYVRDIAQNQIGSIDSGLLVQIDGQKPTGIINQTSTAFTNTSTLLTATGSDGAGSGMKRIQLPNGSYVSGSNATFTASANGTYTFTFEDRVGNISTESITISNIDKTAPSIMFTPEERKADLTDIDVQTAIADSGVSGYKTYRYVWSKEETKPTEGWSEWDATSNPMITQSQGGKWFLHIEAMDYAGNTGYAFSGLYEKIVLSGGPSITINVFPLPTGQWMNQPIDVYVMDSGDAELLSKAKKYYHVSNSPLYPSDFIETIPLDKKIQLNLQGENFIHVQYILDDGTKISSTAGPYLIDTGAVGDFEMKLVNASGVEVTTWTNQPLKLVMGNPLSSSVSGLKKQYRIEGVHTDWQPYTDDTIIGVEGDYRVFGRIISGTGTSSVQKVTNAKVDQTKPTISSLKLVKNINNTYDVRLNSEDILSGVKEVTLNNGTKVTKNNNQYEIDGLAVKPTSVSVTDTAGNNLSSVPFATEPTITFDAPYTLTTPLYRNDVVANLTNATGYIIGNRAYACTSDPCKVILSYNTTLTAVRTEGTKETKSSVQINNIDQSNLQLVLNGKRNSTAPKDITFTWNYALTNATLTCNEDGHTNNYAVTGKSFGLNGKNYTYSCAVTGDYKGVMLASNTVTIHPDGSIPSDASSGMSGREKTTNVYLEETRLGKAYIINGRSDNYKYHTLPIPENEITAN